MTTCAKITPAELIAAKPQFWGVAVEEIEPYIDLAQIWASGFPDSLCKVVQIAIVCHLLTLDGRGDDADSQAFSSGHGDIQTISSGAVTITRFKAASQDAGQTTAKWFAQTACGRMFLALARGIKGGPRVAGAGSRAVSTYAKDAWW